MSDYDEEDPYTKLGYPEVYELSDWEKSKDIIDVSVCQRCGAYYEYVPRGDRLRQILCYHCRKRIK